MASVCGRSFEGPAPQPPSRVGLATTYSHDDNDKLTGVSGGGQSASMGYDGAGNMTSVSGDMYGAWTLVFDDENRLTSLTSPSTTSTFTWNATGRRAGATLEGTARTFSWFGERMLEEYGCNSCCYAGALYAEPSYYAPLLGRQMGGQKQYPINDGIGTARRWVNEAGSPVYDLDLDAFGRNLGYFASASWYPYRFGGAWGYITDPSGMLQLGARFYWPEVGRFIQQDPVGDGMNWYAYAGNNPVSYIDPYGLLNIPGLSGQPFLNFDEGWISWDMVYNASGATISGFASGVTLGQVNLKLGDPCSEYYAGSHAIAKATSLPLGVYGAVQGARGVVQGVRAGARRVAGAARRAGWRVGRQKNVGGVEARFGPNFRVGWHRLPPDKNYRVPWAQGRSLPHYHMRGPGGIGAHRPWQGGWW